MRGLLLVLALNWAIFSPVVHAESDWREEDTERQLAYTVLLVTDLSQTIYISKHTDEYREYNPILGRQPARHRVYQYFVASAVFNGLVAYMLPPNYRKTFQYLVISFEGGVTINNARIGIGMDF